MDDFGVHYQIGQFKVLRYNGYITYEDRTQGQIEAIFIQKNNRWELYGVHIVAPQSRLEKYTPPQEKITPTP